MPDASTLTGTASQRREHFVVLEALESFGGTWLTHRFPGIRSDRDLYTFGYRFKPWTGAPIAAASSGEPRRTDTPGGVGGPDHEHSRPRGSESAS